MPVKVRLDRVPVGRTPGHGFRVRDGVDDEIVGRIAQTFLDAQQNLVERHCKRVNHVVAEFGKTVMMMPRGEKDLKGEARGEGRQRHEPVIRQNQALTALQFLLDQVAE